MTHRAKKVHSGKYHYRGFQIMEMGLDYTAWGIMDKGDYAPFDCANTFKQAKQMVDRMVDA